jgi:hypothetical protein
MIFFAEMGSLRHCDGCGEKKLKIGAFLAEKWEFEKSIDFFFFGNLKFWSR